MAQYRSWTYEELSWVTERVDVWRAHGPSGQRYILEILASWHPLTEDAVQIVGQVRDPETRLLTSTFESFVMSADGEIIPDELLESDDD